MMKRIIIALLLFYNCAFLQAQPESQVVVTDVRISFLVPARSEDKEMTTQISATLYTTTGKRVAMLDKCCGNIHFPDANFTSSTYALDMRNTIFKSEMQSGYFDVHIDPAANDRWIFVPILQINFSDGTKVTIKGPDPGSIYTRREVSQEAPDSSFPFHLQ